MQRSELIQIANVGLNRKLCSGVNSVNLFATRANLIHFSNRTYHFFLRMWPTEWKNGFGEKKMWRGGRELAGSSATYSRQNSSKWLTWKLDVWRSFWYGMWRDRRAPSTSKINFNFERQMLFWSFRDRFWLRGILRFLNETLLKSDISSKSSFGTCRLHNWNWNILKPNKDWSRIFNEPTNFRVYLFSGDFIVSLLLHRLSYYRIITLTL